MRFARWFLFTLLAVLGARCGGEVPLTAPDGATLTIEANPRSISAVGGRSTITVIGFKSTEDGGGTLPDGTQIFFTTNLGVIEERVAMHNGIAKATLQSDGRAGTATINAISGGASASSGSGTGGTGGTGGTAAASGSVTVQIGAGPEGDIVVTVTANPTTLGPTDFTSEIVATLTDNNGNPLPDVPVIFSTTAGQLASQSSVLRTNVKGQAFDRLTLLDDAEGGATVTVTSGTATGSVDVTRGTFALPIIDSVFPSSGTRGASLTVTLTGQKFQPGASVSFGNGIAVKDVTFINAETLLVDITISGSAATDNARTVTVTNPDGGSGTLSSAFVVGSNAPVCKMSAFEILSGSGTAADPWIMNFSLVAFDGTGSFDPDGGSLSFDWDVGDPPTPNYTTATFSHDFSLASPPAYQVVMTVTDDDGDTCTLVRFLDVP